MLKSALILSMALGPVAPMALAQSPVEHELDQERTVVVPLEQKRLSAQLPQTVIIREDSREPGKVEVAHVKDAIPAGKRAENVTFEKMALNSEVRGIAYDTGNELDMTSSTNSWGFGLALGGLGFLAGSALASRAYGYDYAPGYSSSYYDPRYYGSGYYQPRSYYSPRSYTYSSYYRPYYDYSGYRYAYSPYYRYASGNYTYTYCNWPSRYY